MSEYNDKKYIKEKNIDDILKNITYNIFMTLYSELTLDGSIQEYYETYSKVKIDKGGDVIVNEINILNKEIFDVYPIPIGLNKDKTYPTYLDAPWILDKLSSILKRKNRINEDKEFLRKTFTSEEREENGKDGEKKEKYTEIINNFIKDPNYLIFTLNSLFWGGSFGKDIMSLNPHRGMIMTSRYTIVQICELILKRSQELLEVLIQEEKGIFIDSEKYQTTHLTTFFGEGKKNEERDDNDDKEKNSSTETMTGFNYGLIEMCHIIHGGDGLKSLLKAWDFIKLKQEMKVELGKIKNKLKKRDSTIKIDESEFELENFFSENGKEWNRSNINGSQEEEFLGFALTLSVFMKVINTVELEENIEMDKLKEKISQLNKTYLCLGLAALMTVTGAIRDRSLFLRTNLATAIESTFVYCLLGFHDSKNFHQSKSEEIPIFCQLLAIENGKKNDSVVESLSPFSEVLDYHDDDFQIHCRLFNRMNEEYERYSFVRYPGSDQPDKLIIEKSDRWYDILRYVVMILLLIAIHYSLFNKIGNFENSSFNIFKRK
ncbi:hypothetical protein PIROE2DRAFT_7726 [Piromyces sp. E2]|nr:hypothetical protein PIROE2DRAFT_7726 [Piromyces sp. E2]|eukprot:OUM65269.1 hypothetical protein PIROE2DRAFT_7726 [Piromyces sp. E2]